MASKLIFKLKSDSEKLMVLQTEQKKFQISDDGMRKFFISVLDLAGIDYREVDNLATTTDLSNLHLLIKEGFAIRVDELNDHIRFIASKDQASMSFGVSKEMGISRLLLDAEDFAEELLESLNPRTEL